MRKLFEKLKEKHFLGLKTKLYISKVKRPKAGIKAIAGYYSPYRDTIHMKSWVKYCDKKQIKALLLHEMTHATFGSSSSYFHGKRFASRLLSIYRKEFPTSYKSILRSQFWTISPSKVENGLVVVKTYWPKKVIR